MSPQLSTRCALALLGAMVLASAVGLLALGPVSAVAPAHHLTHPRGLLHADNGWSVLLEMPLLLAALAGLLHARRSAIDEGLRQGWTAFFALAAAATLASVIDHLSPSESGHVLAKLPAASACAVLAVIFLAERVKPVWASPPALRLALASGPIGGLLWLASDVLHGQPDFRLLLWLEHLPMLLVPVGVWSLPSRGLQARAWIAALLWFAAAQLIDWADLWVWQLSGGAVSGHALHQVPLAGCLASLAWSVQRQTAGREAAGTSSQRHTSLITSG